MRGDHLQIWRGAFWHHAVDLGKGIVVHFAGPVKDKVSARVRYGSFEEFVGNGSVDDVVVREYGARLDREETVRRAEAMVGKSDYNLFTNNCEHLASWCVTGERESRQVEQYSMSSGVTVVLVSASVLTPKLLDSAGKMTGVSGPGVLSALASTGSLVGGGAVAGLYFLGLVTAGLSTAAVFHVARDKPHLTDVERRARAVARGTALITALLIGSILLEVLSKSGKVKGFSGPGISSGLASIGKAIGSGGMVSGVTVLVATPVVAVTALSTLAYELSKWWQTRTTLPVLNAPSRTVVRHPQ
jgi:hypothetical protein